MLETQIGNVVIKQIFTGKSKLAFGYGKFEIIVWTVELRCQIGLWSWGGIWNGDTQFVIISIHDV